MNTTDPDSRNVKTPRGYLQGYNAQAVVNERQIVVAAEINTDSPDFGHLEPMVDAARDRARAAGRDRTARGGGRRRRLLAPGPDGHRSSAKASRCLIPPDAGKRKGTRPGWDGGPYAFMRRVLETDSGNALYRKRQAIDRAGLRPHQVQPPHRPLPTPRQIRLQVGMATDRRHPQPPQAPPPPHRARGSLRKPAGTSRRQFAVSLSAAAPGKPATRRFTQQPPTKSRRAVAVRALHLEVVLSRRPRRLAQDDRILRGRRRPAHRRYRSLLSCTPGSARSRTSRR